MPAARWPRRSLRLVVAVHRRRAPRPRRRAACGRRSRGSRSRVRAQPHPSRVPTPCRLTRSCARADLRESPRAARAAAGLARAAHRESRAMDGRTRASRRDVPRRWRAEAGRVRRHAPAGPVARTSTIPQFGGGCDDELEQHEPSDVMPVPSSRSADESRGARRTTRGPRQDHRMRRRRPGETVCRASVAHLRRRFHRARRRRIP